MNAVQLLIPVSHHGLLSSEVLTKNRVDRGTGSFKSIFIQVKSVENSVVKSDWKTHIKQNKFNVREQVKTTVYTNCTHHLPL